MSKWKRTPYPLCHFCRVQCKSSDPHTVHRYRSPWVCQDCAHQFDFSFKEVEGRRPEHYQTVLCEVCCGSGEILPLGAEGTDCYPCWGRGFVIRRKSPLVLLAECADE